MSEFNNPYPDAPTKFRHGEFGQDEVVRLRRDLRQTRRMVHTHDKQLINFEIGDSRAPFKRIIMEMKGRLFSVRPKADNTGAVNFSFTVLEEDPDTEEES